MTALATGIVVPLFSKRTFAFSNLAANKTLEYVMIKALDVTDYGDATLLVRVHSKTIQNSAKVEVILKATEQSCDDPSVNFVAASSIASTTVDNSEASPGTVLVAPLPADFGSQLQVIVKGSQDPSSRVSCTVDLSADLALRPASPTKPIIRGDFLPATTLSSNIGSSAAVFKRAFQSHIVSGVLSTSGAATLDDESIIQASGSGGYTLTLPTAAAGWWYIIERTTGASAVTLAAGSGDTVNGGASVSLSTGLHFVYSLDSSQWFQFGPL